MDERHSDSDMAAELRKFGLTMGIAFLLLVLLFLWRAKTWALWLLLPALLFAGCAMARPLLLRKIHGPWMAVAELMGACMTRVILVFMYYLVFTPVGVVARVLNKHFLMLDRDERKESYWQPRKGGRPESGHYEKQY